MAGNINVYACIEEEIIQYHFSVDEYGESFVRKSSVKLPVAVQYAAIDRPGDHLYAVSSDAGSGIEGAAGSTHMLSAFKIDSDTCSLIPLGPHVRLRERPIHLSLHQSGRFAFIAFNKSGTVQACRINSDGTLGGIIQQADMPAAGIFTHQVMPFPSETLVAAVSRGNDARGDVEEEPGMITVLDFINGLLTEKTRIMLKSGEGPRHLEFHPKKPWAYVSVERGNKLHMYRLENGELAHRPEYIKGTLIDEAKVMPKQRAGAIHVHPEGKYLYITNRAEQTIKDGENSVFAGGENNIAVFSIDDETGEPSIIQHIDSQGIEPRTFSIDLSGKYLFVGNQKAMKVRNGDSIAAVPANIAIFKINEDGKLTFIKRYEFEADGRRLFWVGALK